MNLVMKPKILVTFKPQMVSVQENSRVFILSNNYFFPFKALMKGTFISNKGNSLLF